MKQLAIVSGKGGTGKTTITSLLAQTFDNKIMVDCDVDAANLHLLLKPNIIQSTDFYSGKKAAINPFKCTECGRCEYVCRFDAVIRQPDGGYKIDDLSCNGCGACTITCRYEAITLENNLAGKFFISETEQGNLVHAALGIAEDNSGKLVARIREEAFVLADENSIDLILIDGPPGIGCPVISSITGVDLLLVVTEPSLTGLHDLKRLLKLAQGFKLPSVVMINKCDLNSDLCSQVEAFCRDQDIPIIASIPFEKKLVSMAHNKDIASQTKAFNIIAESQKELISRLNL